MQPKTKAILAGGLLLTALVSLRFTLRSPTPMASRPIFSSLGLVLAQQVAAATVQHGPVVVVVPEGFERPDTVLHSQWSTFVGELKNKPGMTIVPLVVPVTGDPLVLHDILDQHPQAAALVYFVNPPGWEEFQVHADQPRVPKIIMVGNPDLPAKAYYGRFFEAGHLAALILPRPASTIGQTPAKSPREYFDKYYQVYTWQNYESLSD